MATADQHSPSPNTNAGPASFVVAAGALDAIREALSAARTAQPGESPGPGAGPDQALASLLLLREVREELAAWETGLIEAARGAGANWADLAHPLGVASRQAAERRYLRLRPGGSGTTGEQRVKATRDLRAADRSVSAWARGNAADLRRLAGQITALTDLPAAARTPLGNLHHALADNDAAALVGPLTATGPHLEAGHPDLATRIDAITRHTKHLRQDSIDRRNSV